MDYDVMEFIKSFIKTFENLSAKVKPDDRILLFPPYLVRPHNVRCIISTANKVAFEWLNQNYEWKFDVIRTDKDIEDSIFPRLDGKITHIVNRAINCSFIDLNLITKEYYDHNRMPIEVLSRASNLVLHDAASFVRVESGDIRFLDVGLAWRQNQRDYVKKVICVWIFASAQQLDPQVAELRAQQEYSSIISNAMNGIPISVLAGTLKGYSKLLEKKPLLEEEMQVFLKNNFVILEPGYRRIFTKDELKKFKFPEADFLLLTHDAKYVIVELESPEDHIFTYEKEPNPSRELREAQSQIQRYLTFFRNNILYCRNIFPDMSVENVKGLIVIGRSSLLNNKQKQSLESLAGTTIGYEIVTYDELFQRTNSLLENISIRYGMYK